MAQVDILNPTRVPKIAEESEKAKPIGEVVVGNGLHTIKNGANRISDCPIANETLRAALDTSSAVFGLD